METADIELAAELVLGTFAELQDFKLPDFVSKRLARDGHVPVGLALDIGFIDGRVILEKIDDLLSRPMLVVKTSIDDQPDGAQHIVRRDLLPYLEVQRTVADGAGAFTGGNDRGVRHILAEQKRRAGEA